MSETDIIRKLYTFFRRGVNELGFLITVYNMILLQQLRGISFNMGFIVILLMFAVITGWIEIKKVNPTNVYVNPASQDTMTASYYLYEGFLCFFNNDIEKAKEYFMKGSALREKWINK